jgi:uncharacterized small protein (DUF1192 family)
MINFTEIKNRHDGMLLTTGLGKTHSIIQAHKDIALLLEEVERLEVQRNKAMDFLKRLSEL